MTKLQLQNLDPWYVKYAHTQWAHNVKMTSYQRRCDVGLPAGLRKYLYAEKKKKKKKKRRKKKKKKKKKKKRERKKVR